MGDLLSLGSRASASTGGEKGKTMLAGKPKKLTGGRNTKWLNNKMVEKRNCGSALAPQSFFNARGLAESGNSVAHPKNLSSILGLSLNFTNLQSKNMLKNNDVLENTKNRLIFWGVGFSILNMVNVTISKIEYQNLKEKADAYSRVLKAAKIPVSLVPTEKSRKKIISSLKKTSRYNQKFLSSVSKGLKRSDYFTE